MGDFNACVGRKISSSIKHCWSVVYQRRYYTEREWFAAHRYCVREHSASGFIDVWCSDLQRWSWRHPRRSRARLNHIFVPSIQMRFVSRSFVPSNITIFTDHRYVVCEIRLLNQLSWIHHELIIVLSFKKISVKLSKQKLWVLLAQLTLSFKHRIISPTRFKQYRSKNVLPVKANAAPWWVFGRNCRSYPS